MADNEARSIEFDQRSYSSGDWPWYLKLSPGDTDTRAVSVDGEQRVYFETIEEVEAETGLEIHVRGLIEVLRKEIDLAIIYLEDGARHTALGKLQKMQALIGEPDAEDESS